MGKQGKSAIHGWGSEAANSEAANKFKGKGTPLPLPLACLVLIFPCPDNSAVSDTVGVAQKSDNASLDYLFTVNVYLFSETADVVDFIPAA